MTTSFESHLAELLDELATGGEPLAHVSVAAAIQRGNSQLRWRRVGLAFAAPALAAAVAAALVGIVPLVVHQDGGSAPSASLRAGSLPVFRTDARFGWLPVGEHLMSGLQSPTMAYMNISAGRTFSWELTVWAAGTCVLHSGANGKLICQFGGGVAPATYALDGHAPSMHGRGAFWISDHNRQQEISWEYATGAWAVFQSPSCCSKVANRQPDATLLRIARAISFGAASGEPLSFNFQLTDVPADWSVSSVGYEARSGSLVADGVELTGQHSPRVKISLDLSHAGAGNADPCWTSAPGPTRHTMLRGYAVETTTNPPSDSNGGLGQYQLCAPDAGGSGILVTTSDHAERTPSDLFEHMRFLGPKAARWVTNPIG